MKLRVATPFACLVSGVLLSATAWAAPITWTGGGGTTLWSNPANWDTGFAPTTGYDVVIAVGSPTTLVVDYSVYLGSLQCNADLVFIGGVYFETTSGTSSITGEVALEDTYITSRGVGTSLTFAGGVTIVGSAHPTLIAMDGAAFKVTGSSLAVGGSTGLILEAFGAGSLFDLSSITTLKLDAASGLRLDAAFGGKIDLKSASWPNLGELGLYAEGTDSTIDLSAFKGALAFASTWAGSGWQIVDNGKVVTGSLTSLSLTHLGLRNPGLFDVSGLTRLNGPVTLAGGTFAFPALTTPPTGGVTVSGGGQLAFPAVTSIVIPDIKQVTCTVSGVGSLLDLSNVTTLDFNNTGSLLLDVSAGGKVDLKSATWPNHGGLTLSASGPDSTIDLSAFTGALTFYSTRFGNSWTISDGGKLLTGTLTSLNPASLTVSNPGLFDVTSLTSLSGSFALGAGTLTFPALTALPDGGVTVNGGGHLAFPAVTSIVFPHFNALGAMGVGSLLDLSSVTTLDFNTLGYLYLTATGGGKIDLKNAPWPNHGGLYLDASGKDSTIDLSAFSGALTFYLYADPYRSDWSIVDGGNVVTGTLTGLSLLSLTLNNVGQFEVTALASFTGHLSLTAGAFTFPTLTRLPLGGIGVSGGAHLAFPAVTSIIIADGNQISCSASGLGSLLDLSGVSTLDFNATGRLYLTAGGGGKIDLNNASWPNHGALDFYVHDADSTIDLSSFRGSLAFGTDSPGSFWNLGPASKVLTGTLTSLSLNGLTLSNPGRFDTTSLTNLVALLDLGDTSIEFPVLATVTGGIETDSDLINQTFPALNTVNGAITDTLGGSLNFPALTSVNGDIVAHHQAQLNFPVLRAVNGRITARDGRSLSFPTLRDFRGSVYADSRSVISFPALTSLNLGDGQSMSAQATESSTIDLSAVATINLTPLASLSLLARGSSSIDLSHALTPTAGEFSAEAGGGPSLVNLSSMREGCLPVSPDGSYSLIESGGDVIIIPNGAPVAVNDHAWTDMNHTIALPVSKIIRNDTDADCATLIARILNGSTAAGGSVDDGFGLVFIYHPPPGFVGVDSFDYQIADQHGGTANGTVMIEVRSIANDKNVVSVTALPSGHLLVKFAALPNSRYNLELSFDLVNWTFVSNIATASNGSAEYEDDLSLPSPTRFYRLVE